MAPSTFASAAASGNSQNQSTRAEVAGEWVRRTNGATQTFRRPSLVTTQSNSTHQREMSTDAQPARYVPPYRNGSLQESRYSKGQLLELYKTQYDSDNLHNGNLSSLYVAGWEPTMANGGSAGGWSRRDDSLRDNMPALDVCWDQSGSKLPLSLADLTDDEKELFSSSVNSTIKPPTTTNREGTPREGLALRKVSVSHVQNSPNTFAINSPTNMRSGGRRREASESYPFPQSSTTLPKARDEGRPSSPPSSVRRRTTDFKDSLGDAFSADDDHATGNESSETQKPALSSVGRSSANPVSAGSAGPSSPWASAQPTAGFSPMGSFGNFASGSHAGVGTPTEKRSGLGARAESRFKGLMSKESNDEIGRLVKEKASLGNINKATEAASWRPQWPGATREAAEHEEEVPSGSAALRGGQDISPPRTLGFGTPSRQGSRDEYGFGAFGMTSDANSRGLVHNQQHTPQNRTQQQTSETMSPTNTNPYQSPEQDHADPNDVDTDVSDFHEAHLPGLGGFMNDGAAPSNGHFGALPGFGNPTAAATDRSQTSSTGPQRAFGGLAGLGAISGLGTSSGWGANPGSIGTPLNRAGALGFGDHGFGLTNELQSPSLAGLGPNSFFGSQSQVASGAGRGASRLGSLFAQGTHDQRPGDSGRMPQDGKTDLLEGTGSVSSRDTDPTHALGSDPDRRNGDGLLSTSGSTNQGPSPSMQPQPIGSSASNQPPTAQQKTMVMPDRMRWIYRDPQGNTQGPWSGLEMHDWYKAGFFSPELLVKKFEDTDYEPLAQLIRRIGNSREPFLVPQIGIPHGATSQVNFHAGPPGPGPLTAAGAQPPFANSFPSFGTTLTADQQNALERRKQEEQYLMARQKEHLAQQQLAQRIQMHGQHSGHSHQLQHHASAQSLHSQPSFSNITSPNNYPPASAHGSSSGAHSAGFFDNSVGQGRGFGPVGTGVEQLGHITEEDLPNVLDRLGLDHQRSANFGAPGQPLPHQQQGPGHAQSVSTMLDDRARLQQEQAQHDMNSQSNQESQLSDERLREFQDLQSNLHGARMDSEHDFRRSNAPNEDFSSAARSDFYQSQQLREPQSLTEQVQQAVSAQQTPAAPSPWGKIDSTLPQPFPPAPSQSPLPAPAAQRNRSHVADNLNAESRSASQTPSLETPSASIAPWAKEPVEASRGPSLKDIQEAEARSAAKADALAAEARRAQLEKEELMQAQAQAQMEMPTAGLPTSSTWASANMSSAAGAGAPSPWAKASKPATSAASAKSMAQIQKEEETRKKKIAAAAAAQQTAAQGAAAAQATGKRYAELASKVAAQGPSPGPQGNIAWTTVGASGKVKAPTTTTPAPARIPSAIATAASVSAIKKPAPVRTATGVQPSGAANAQEDFKKWAVNELRHDLNKGVPAEEFVTNLLAFPSEIDIVTEAVHSVSNTIDSRHYAEEFLRRRKLADKGQFDASTLGKSGSPASVDRGQSGWSEVAKKGPKEAVKEDAAGNGSFKVVAAKKKASKR